ncbi:MAG: DUF1707 domain-containing protein [Rhodococcus sp. (in: high G+C Gram-positive bacteria)]|jgi:hypothetical protein|uniref:DUF1707 SHOCT-like domain-containing protein n=1 Tax=Rhodococcus sp. EPR-157 TaxID=1813677 RepID=UPI0007BC16C7|nr:DUF1707 domain-containing protein [Rhodococcus sp. EPR-157]KZF09524.1 hypothetical protein A2J03_00385 [Rhodococcus sp. EPR-157]
MASTSKYRSTALRARDIDRALTATALDTAYADGQLTFGEHRLRTERARTAVTLDELRRLVSDLQLDVDLPEPEAGRSASRPRVLLALGSVVIVAAGLVLFFATREDKVEVAAVAAPVPSPVETVSMPVPDDVTPIVARPFVFDTATGLDDFRNRFIERFGSSQVVSLSLQVDEGSRADVYRLDAEGRVERIMVNGGFEPQKDTSLPEEGQLGFDWNLLDSAVVAGVIAGAPETVGAPQGVVDWVSIDNDEGEQRISVSVSVPDLSGGWVETDFAGNPTHVSPARR